MSDCVQVQSAHVFLHDEAPAYVVSTATAQAGDGIVGHVWLHNGSERFRLTEEEGDYDAVRAVCADGVPYTVYVKYSGRANTVVLACGDRDCRTVELTRDGKFFHPDIAVFDGRLFVVWENRQSGGSVLEYVVITPGELIVTPAKAVPAGGLRCYAPSVAVDGRGLVLGYECFDGERYRIALCRLDDVDGRFSEPCFVGFSEGNDTAVRLSASADGVYFAWENSRPIDTDYTWFESHTGRTLTMPAFGHGWRVKSRMAVGKLDGDGPQTLVRGAGILPACPEGVPPSETPANRQDVPSWPVRRGRDALETRGQDARATENAIVRGESGGMPRAFMDGGRLYVLYLLQEPQFLWTAKLEAWTGDAFDEIELPAIVYGHRKSPPCVLFDGSLHILCYDAAGGCELRSLPLPPLSPSAALPASCFAPKFVPAACAAPVPKHEEPRPAIRGRDETLHLFWGDLHMHSNISLCSIHPKFHCTDVEDKHRFSRDVGGLDFCMLTDHTTMTDLDWLRTRRTGHLADTPGQFVSYVGFEWSCSALHDRHCFGHYNVLYKDDGGLFRVQDDHPTITSIWNDLTPGQALTIPHHPGDIMHELDWNFYDERFVPLVEIFQVRGSYEYAHCRMHPETYSREITRDNSVRVGLNRGYRMGFTSGGEHEGVGITAVYATALTREAIFDALAARRVYGSTCKGIVMDFRIDGQLFGSVLSGRTMPRAVTVRVKGTAPISAVYLVTRKAEHPLPGDGSDTFVYDGDGGLPHYATPEWVYLRVEQADGNTAWTSPIWFADAL